MTAGLLVEVDFELLPILLGVLHMEIVITNAVS